MKHKILAIKCFLFTVLPRGVFVLVPDLLAPIVVPMALLFTKREDNNLPKLFRWWDNDVSINGDREEYWATEYEGGTYYSKHHPRSFLARYTWLGFRNRASKIAQDLGYFYPGPTDVEQDRETWGTYGVGRSKAGWIFNRSGKVYQIYIVKRIGKMCIRVNYGFKIWAALDHDHREQAMVVNISFSLVSFKPV